MTNEELATAIATLPIEAIDEVANLAFDKVMELRLVQEIQAYQAALMNAGIDVRPICRKKVPT